MRITFNFCIKTKVYHPGFCGFKLVFLNNSA